jgi:hypothetical protein
MTPTREVGSCRVSAMTATVRKTSARVAGALIDAHSHGMRRATDDGGVHTTRQTQRVPSTRARVEHEAPENVNVLRSEGVAPAE